MSTPVGIIKKFVKTLVETKKTGEEAVNEALAAVGVHGEYNDYGEYGSYYRFRQEFEDAQSNYSNQDFLEQVCGVRINNKDTGAITGSDAGGKTTKTAESIIPESSKATKLTNAQYNSFTKNGLKVNVTYSNNYRYDGSSFNNNMDKYLEKQRLVVRALYNWWIPESLDLINESLGINLTDGRSSINEINLVFVVDDYNWHYDEVEVSFDYDLGLASSATLSINAGYIFNITENDLNGEIPTSKGIYSSGTSYLDRLILQAMTEIVLKANIPYFYELPDDISGGLCGIVGGYDDASTNYNSFTTGDYAAPGYARLRYLAKNYSDGMPDGVSYNTKKTILTVTTDFEEKTLDLADFESTVKTVKASALKKGITIIGNKLNNSIVGGSGNDSINGGAGNDSLWGGKGNDTLTGGKGDDVFIYSAGNDVIKDYAAGDRISIGAAISNTKLSGDDVVFTIGKNTLTVKDGANKTLNMINAKGKAFETVVSSATTLTINNKTTSPVTLTADVGTADASKRTKAIKIYGNKLDNVILGGSKADTLYGQGGNDSILGNSGNDVLYGGAGDDTLNGGAGTDKLYGGAGADKLYGGKGNDTLIGGAGNDSLWGDVGADTFIYSSGGGNDVIYGFDKNDTLTLDTIDFTATYKNQAVTLKFDEGSVTFKDFTATTFHINDDTYKISGSKFKKQ